MTRDGSTRRAHFETLERPPMPLPEPGAELAGRVAVVTGASRGIGRAVALALARAGARVVCAAKSGGATSTSSLPGDVHGVARECGNGSIGVVTNVLDERSMIACVETAVRTFGRVDILVNNASALWWQDIEDTPTKKYDLINGVNSRGSFIMTRECMRVMKKGGYGRVINMGPPIPDASRFREYETKTAYYISKCGMTMVALGAAAEGRKHGITGNSLWPATIVESLASENFQLGERDNWRKADILADCVVQLCLDGNTTGQMLIDDEYLRTRGAVDEDFVKYRCNPDVEPPRLLAPGSSVAGWDVRRGDVKALAKDKARSKL